MIQIRADKSHALAVVLIAAAALVVLRALPYLLFEQLAFDSDQAIVGLMAKHLAERRALPLFFYGQTYMLGVEAWAAAPFFVAAGPTITTLRISILAWNLAFVWLLIAALRRDCGLSPWAAFVPAMIFALAPVSVATQLMAARGGIIEPFVWVIVLWLLRRRPLWFGAALAVGFRNREFTAYAVPALLAVELAAGLFDRSRLRDWLAANVVFILCWQTIEAVKPWADLAGPGTRGRLIAGFAGSQITNLIDRADFNAAEFLERARRMVPEILKWFSGAGQIETTLPVSDRDWLAWAATAALAIMAVRVGWLLVRSEGPNGQSVPTTVRRRIAGTGFAFYLIGIGAIAITVFLASKPVLAGYSRYALLGLLLPIGIVSALLSLERRPAVHRVTVGIVSAWALIVAADHVLVSATYVRSPPLNAPRQIVDQLAADGISTAMAGYWRAYVLTFVSQERVRVAVRDFVRIQEYQDEFERSKDGATILEEPCPGGRPVAGLYICKP